MQNFDFCNLQSSFSKFSQSLKHLLWRDRQGPDPDADGVTEGVANNWSNGHDRGLRHALRTEWPRPVAVLQHRRMKGFRDLRHHRQPVLKRAGIQDLALLLDSFFEKGVNY